ncbi:lachnocin radical SAM maturase [Clostridium sp. Marseille-P2415]|uniref:lachnocin radical SAM maturase n=1 Tax=Clostridium sp. Marseille-P2415 TaxID=1805471 RepID=UPI0009887503|nr:lachnocin radical SAM maturase [Clostridium sp. Marseille-P2415]
MYLSKIIKSSSNMYIYDALNNNFATINSEEDILDDNKYTDFLINNNFRDIKKSCEFDVKYSYSKDELINMFTSKIKNMTLALTEQCNLRCKYCGYMPKYIDDNYLLKDMPIDVAFKAIDILMKNSCESEICNLSFYGGEPLLRLELIKECIDYISNKYPFRKPSYNITTNAVLLDDKVADFIIENDITINISFDGPQKYQNKYRVDCNGNGSYEKVYQNIQALYRKDPKFFRENVTYNVVMYNGASNDLFESIDNLWKSDVNMINLFPTEYFMNFRDKSDEINKGEKVNIRTYDFAYKNMLKGMKKYYNSFSGPACSNTILPGGFCVPGVRKNFVTTDGKIIVCEKVDESQKIFEIGDVYNGIDINKIERLVGETLKSLEKCKYCWAAKFCKICFKDILNINNEFCEKSRKDVESELSYYLDHVSNNRGLVNYVANISMI